MRRDDMEQAQWPVQDLLPYQTEPLKTSPTSNHTSSGTALQSILPYPSFGSDFQHHENQIYTSSETGLSSSSQSLQNSPSASVALSTTTFSNADSPHSYLGANESSQLGWEKTQYPIDSHTVRYDHLYQFFSPDKHLTKPQSFDTNQLRHTPLSLHFPTNSTIGDMSTCSTCHDGEDSNICIPDACGAASPPCEDPTCEDVLPCSEPVGPCIPDQCWGVVCTDESCAPRTLDEPSWCDQRCLESTCVTPGCGEQCLTAPECDQGCTTLPCCPEYVSLRDICCQDHANEAMRHMHASSMHVQNHHSPSTSLDMLRLACTGALDNKHTHVRHHLSTLQQKPHTVGQDDSDTKPQPQHHDSHAAGIRPPKRLLSEGARARKPSKAAAKRTRTSHAHESTPPLCLKLDHTHCKLSSCYNVVTPMSESDRQEALTCKWIVSDRMDNSAQPITCGHVFNSSEELQLHVESQHIDAMMQRKADERRQTQQNRRRSGSTASTDTASTESAVSTPLFCMWQGCSRCGGADSYLTEDKSGAQGNGFAVRGKLQIHIRTHTGHKPYACTHPGCTSRFKTADALCKHVRTHTGEKPYACPEPGCGRAFATPTELRTHETVHTGARPHRCNVCGQRFADASNLSKHRKTHREKGNVCLQCGTRFTRADQLERHCLKMGHCLDILKRKDSVASRRASIASSTTLSPPVEHADAEFGAVDDSTRMNYM